MCSMPGRYKGWRRFGPDSLSVVEAHEMLVMDLERREEAKTMRYYLQ
jgi:hypothetical protein